MKSFWSTGLSWAALNRTWRKQKTVPPQRIPDRQRQARRGQAPDARMADDQSAVSKSIPALQHLGQGVREPDSKAGKWCFMRALNYCFTQFQSVSKIDLSTYFCQFHCFRLFQTASSYTTYKGGLSGGRYFEGTEQAHSNASQEGRSW